MSLVQHRITSNPSRKDVFANTLTVDQLGDLCRLVVFTCDTHLNSPNSKIVVSGRGDTGTITVKSEADISTSYLRWSRALLPGSTSEEDEKNAHQMRMRMEADAILLFDSLDGTGDAVYGAPGTPSGDGYSSLAALITNEGPQIGICFRPAYRELYVFTGRTVARYEIKKEPQLLSYTFFSRQMRSPATSTFRMNTRPAYPDTNFPLEFFDSIARESSSGLTIQQEPAGGAGDCFCRLIRGELDIVCSGRKTDWKLWDTAPFSKTILEMGGRVTDYRGNPLSPRNHRSENLWHTEGVLASIDASEAHDAILAQLNRARSSDGGFIYDPRVRK